MENYHIQMHIDAGWTKWRHNGNDMVRGPTCDKGTQNETDGTQCFFCTIFRFLFVLFSSKTNFFAQFFQHWHIVLKTGGTSGGSRGHAAIFPTWLHVHWYGGGVACDGGLIVVVVVLRAGPGGAGTSGRDLLAVAIVGLFQSGSFDEFFTKLLLKNSHTLEANHS